MFDCYYCQSDVTRVLREMLRVSELSTSSLHFIAHKEFYFPAP